MPHCALDLAPSRPVPDDPVELPVGEVALYVDGMDAVGRNFHMTSVGTAVRRSGVLGQLLEKTSLIGPRLWKGAYAALADDGWAVDGGLAGEPDGGAETLDQGGERFPLVGGHG